jgi:DNA-binding response OmpR family regulator
MASGRDLGVPLEFPPCILLADDDGALRSVLASVLRKQGYEVIECRNGQELLDHLDCFAHPYASDDFDLIISDNRMPGANGLDILDGLQRCHDYPPMLLITAFGDDATHEEAHRLGALGVLNKPFELDEFVDRVSQIL